VWARAARAAVIACGLIGITGDSRIGEYPYRGYWNVAFTRIETQEAVIWAQFIDLIEKSRLMVAFAGRGQVIDASQNDRCRGCIRLQSFNVFWAQSEEASLKQFFTREQGEALPHVFQKYFSPIIAFFPRRLVVFGLADCYEFPFNINKFCWRPANILKIRPEKKDPTIGAELQRGLYLILSEMHPGPLVGFHRIQLALHDSQLPIKREILQSSNANRNGSEDRYRNGSPHRISGGSILGFFFLLIGAALMKTAFYLADAPRNPMGIVVFAWGIGLAAALIIWQGTILILTGNWLP
jgi:hypothetical protein